MVARALFDSFATVPVRTKSPMVSLLDRRGGIVRLSLLRFPPLFCVPIGVLNQQPDSAADQQKHDDDEVSKCRRCGHQADDDANKQESDQKVKHRARLPTVTATPIACPVPI